MANPTDDSGLLAIYKRWYDDRKMTDVLTRESPILRDTPMTVVGGDEFAYATNYSAGGASSASAIVAARNAAAGQGKTVQWLAQRARLFSIFNITPQEIMASENVRGAFVPAPVIKMGDGLHSMRRLWATSLYGTGYGEVGQVGGAGFTSAADGTNALDVGDYSIIKKLDLGVTFKVTDGATPASPLRAGLATITAINGTVIHFTYTAVELWAATDYIEIEGCRDGSNPALPYGLPSVLPYADRSSTFYGVDRSLFVDRLSGSLITRTHDETLSDVVTRGLNQARWAGNGNEMMWIVNNYDYADFIAEITGVTQLMQQTNVAGKGSDNMVTRGLAEAQFRFQNSFLSKIYDDPFCPRGKSWIVDKDSIEIILLGGEKVVQDGINGNDPGVGSPVDATGLDYKFAQPLIDRYMTTQAGELTDGGPVVQTILQIYPQLICRQPGHCVVLNLVNPSA